jgi:hypothetical protein
MTAPNEHKKRNKKPFTITQSLSLVLLKKIITLPQPFTQMRFITYSIDRSLQGTGAGTHKFTIATSSPMTFYKRILLCFFVTTTE